MEACARKSRSVVLSLNYSFFFTILFHFCLLNSENVSPLFRMMYERAYQDQRQRPRSGRLNCFFEVNIN
jgi:hypothetical protein